MKVYKKTPIKHFGAKLDVNLFLDCCSILVNHFQGQTGAEGPPGPSGPSGDQVSSQVVDLLFQ